MRQPLVGIAKWKRREINTHAVSYSIRAEAVVDYAVSMIKYNVDLPFDLLRTEFSSGVSQSPST